MGYSYGQNERGHWVLSCDECGNVGGVRKRTCPYKVLGDSLRSVHGRRHEMNYCYPPAVCPACFAKLGGTRGIHGDDCRTGAAASQAQYDAIETALDAGEAFVTSACGDWHDTVPSGLVGVTFNGRSGEVNRLVPAGDYAPGPKPRLSDYPGAIPWDGPNARQSSAA